MSHGGVDTEEQDVNRRTTTCPQREPGPGGELQKENYICSVEGKERTTRVCRWAQFREAIVGGRAVMGGRAVNGWMFGADLQDKRRMLKAEI